MDNLVSGGTFLLLGVLAFLAGLSPRMWRGEESRYRIGAIVVGLIFMGMGILALLGYIEIKSGS